MPENSGPGPAGTQPPAGAEALVTAMLGGQAGGLADYCRALTGREDEAAAAARAALLAAQECLTDAGQLRAFLFGLARREALAGRPAGPAEADYTPEAMLPAFTVGDLVATDPGAGEAGGRPGDPLIEAFRGMRSRHREVLDLVYRHGIRPAALPAVLGVSAEDASTLLAAARQELAGRSAAAAAAVPEAAAVPGGTADGRAAAAWTRPAGALASPLARRRVRLAAVFALPVAVVAGLAGYLAETTVPGGPSASVSAGVTLGPAGGPPVASQRAAPRPSPAPNSSPPGPSGGPPGPSIPAGSQQQPPAAAGSQPGAAVSQPGAAVSQPATTAQPTAARSQPQPSATAGQPQPSSAPPASQSPTTPAGGQASSPPASPSPSAPDTSPPASPDGVVPTVTGVLSPAVQLLKNALGGL